MDLRTEFIKDWLRRDHSVAELCELYGISRKTGYKLISRFSSEGIKGLEDMSRRPHSHPATTNESICELICAMRAKHPREGAVTLLERLRRKYPELKLPAPSTAHEVLRRAGLVGTRHKRRKASPTAAGNLSVPESSNHVLSIDFKGDFCLGNGQRCFPLTITDNYSRFLLRCVGMENHSRGYEKVRAVMEACFAEHGLPAVIRSDNGAPFASTGMNGWSRLSVWWMRLGIVPERIEPGKPQQNGRHERMHRTLKSQVCKPAAYDMRAQQDRFDAFRQDYNFERPHHGINLRTPAELYVPSRRQMPLRINPVEYPQSMLVRKVHDGGRIKLDGQKIRIGMALEDEYIGLQFEDDDRTVSVYFGELLIGTIDLLQPWRVFTPR
jgi:putative transposase